MYDYTLNTKFNALETIEENKGVLLSWGIDISAYGGTPMWVIVQSGSTTPVAVIDDATFQASYIKTSS